MSSCNQKTIDNLLGLQLDAGSMNASSINVTGGVTINDANNNVKIGTLAGNFITTGYNNILIGNQAGYYGTIMHDNIVQGTQAGYYMGSNTYENTILGMQAGYHLISGTRNCAYGYQCGYSMDTSSFNVLMGNQCGFNLKGDASSKNVMIGYNNGKYPTNISESVYLGQECGQYTNGAYNVALGFQSGGGEQLVAALTGTAIGGDNGSIIFNSTFSSVDDFYNGWYVTITGGTGAVQTRRIYDYIGSTRKAYVDPWSNVGKLVIKPDTTTQFNLFNASVYATRDTFIGYKAGANITAPYGPSGTAQTGGATSITLPTSFSDITDYYKTVNITLTGGMGAGQIATISAYDGSTKIATVTPAWGTIPNATTVFTMYSNGQALGGTTNTIIFPATGFSSYNDYYDEWYITITGGTGAIQTKSITSYDGASKTATINSTWDNGITPDVSTKFSLYNGSLDSVCVGTECGKSMDNSKYVTYVGSYCGQNAKGDRNVAIGYQCSNDVGNTGSMENVVAIGTECNKNMYNINLQDIVAIGTKCAYQLQGDTDSSVMIGTNCGYGAKGSSLVMIGDSCGYDATGDYLVLIGKDCGKNINDDNCVCIGTNSGAYSTGISDSVFIGNNSGRYLNGNSNVAIGQFAGNGDTTLLRTASNTVFIGYKAGGDITDNVLNSVCIGTECGKFMESGQNDTYIGAYSGVLAVGEGNVYIGTACGHDYNESNENVGIGYQCMQMGGGGGGSNTAIGSRCLRKLDTGTINVAIGYECCEELTTGSSNTTIGNSCCNQLTSGYKNVCIGDSCGKYADVGYHLVAIGTEAYKYPFPGDSAKQKDQICIGYRAGYRLKGVSNILIGTSTGGGYDDDPDQKVELFGDYNVCLGPYASQLMSYGSSNVILGYQSAQESNCINNSVTIGFQAMKYGSGDDNIIQSTAQVGGTINTIKLSSDSSIYDDAYLDYYIVITSGTGYGQTRKISGYAASTKVATIYINWDSVLNIPDATSTYNLLNPIQNAVCIGYQSGFRNNAQNTISIGTGSMSSGYITGNNNLSIGTGTSILLNSGSDNCVLGNLSGQTLTDGSSNVILGYKAMNQGNTSNSVCIGYQAGYWNNGLNTVAIGKGAIGGTSIMTGDNNLAIGTGTAISLLAGSDNCILGNSAGQSLTNGDSNVVLGYQAMKRGVNSSSSVCIGNLSGFKNDSADNVCIGTNAMGANYTGVVSSATSNTLTPQDLGPNYSGTASAVGSVTTIHLDSSSFRVDGAYEGMYIRVRSFGGTVSTRLITSYVYTTRGTVTVSPAFTIGTTTTTSYQIRPASMSPPAQVEYVNTITGESETKPILSYDYLTNIISITGTWTTIPTSTGYTFSVYQLTTGSSNLVLGNYAGRSLTTGSNNFIAGTNAGQNATTLSNSVLIGTGSGQTYGGQDSVMIGTGCGRNTLNINSLVLIGKDCGLSTTSTNTVMIGFEAGKYASGCDSTVLIGQQCGLGLSGDNNTYIGYKCCGGVQATNTGTSMVAIGSQCGYLSTSGTNSVMVGTRCGYNSNGILDCVFLGTNAGFKVSGNTSTTSGMNIIAIGTSALNTTSTFIGSNSIFIGTDCARNINDGDSNCIIGDQCLKNAIGNISRNSIIGYKTGYSLQGIDTVWGSGYFGAPGVQSPTTNSFTFAINNYALTPNIGNAYTWNQERLKYTLTGKGTYQVKISSVSYIITSWTVSSTPPLRSNTDPTNYTFTITIENIFTPTPSIGTSWVLNNSPFDNILIGSNVAENSTTVFNSIYIGSQSGINLNGANNILIGYKSMNTGTSTINNCIAIGQNTSIANGIVNSTAIGNNVSVTSSNVIVIGTASETAYIPYLRTGIYIPANSNTGISYSITTATPYGYYAPLVPILCPFPLNSYSSLLDISLGLNRIGFMHCITLTKFTDTTTSSSIFSFDMATQYYSNGNYSSSVLPSENIVVPIRIIVNNLQETGLLRITTAGIVSIGRDNTTLSGLPTAFPTGQICGWVPIHVCYATTQT